MIIGSAGEAFSIQLIRRPNARGLPNRTAAMTSAYVVTVEGQARPTQPALPSAGTVMIKATPERSDAAPMV